MKGGNFTGSRNVTGHVTGNIIIYLILVHVNTLFEILILPATRGSVHRSLSRKTRPSLAHIWQYRVAFVKFLAVPAIPSS